MLGGCGKARDLQPPVDVVKGNDIMYSVFKVTPR